MAQYTFDSILGFNVANGVLPSGYTKQLSLISDGNQYILLPSTNGNPSGVQIKFKILTPYKNWSAIYGQISSYTAPLIQQASGSARFFYSNGAANVILNCDNNEHIVNINYKGDKKIVFDGNLLFNSSVYYTNNKPLVIFNAYNTNDVYNGQPCEIFYAESTINDTNGNVLSKMTLIPASNGSDLGLYDVENDIFYTNNGTGSFTSGGIAPTYSFQNGDEIIISSTKTHYHYQDGDLVFWYKEIPSLVFKGITFEQTDYWQKPEFVFRGFSFEIADKSGGSKPLFQGIV